MYVLRSCFFDGADIVELGYILAASLVFACAGALLAWPAAALPRLTTAAEAPALSSAQGSWAVAALHAGQVLGALPGGLLAARAGRRATLLLCAPPLVAAWLLLAFAGDVGDGADGVAAVLVARALGGVGVGAAFAAGPLYAAEAASARLRGAAGALVQLTLSAGQLLSYCSGAWLSLRTLALVAAALPLLFVVAFWRAPESPHWLLRRGRREEAVRALRLLRGTQVAPRAIEAEVEALEAFACGVVARSTRVEEGSAEVARTASVDSISSPNSNIHEIAKEEDETNKNITTQRANTSNEVQAETTEKMKRTDTLMLTWFRDYTFQRMVILVLALVILQSVGGVGFMLPYTAHVFEDAPLSSDIAYIVLGSVQLCGSIGAPFLLAAWGRRPSLLTSSAVTTLALLGRVICQRVVPSSRGAAMGALVTLYIAAFTHALALAPLPIALAAEMTPEGAREVVVTVAAAVGAATIYAAACIHQALWHAGSPYMVTFFSAASSGVVAWLAFGQLPEIHGLTLQQVQKTLRTTFQQPQQTPFSGSADPREVVKEQDSATSQWKQIVIYRIKLGWVFLSFSRTENTRSGLPLEEVCTQRTSQECEDTRSNLPLPEVSNPRTGEGFEDKRSSLPIQEASTSKMDKDYEETKSSQPLQVDSVPRMD